MVIYIFPVQIAPSHFNEVVIFYAKSSRFAKI